MTIKHELLYNEIISQVTEATLSTIKGTNVVCEENIELFKTHSKAITEGTYMSPADILESVLATME